MENFKQIDPAEITDNFIRAIGREWMLVTAGNRESCNTMTASWGLIGFIWGRPVAQFVIRPQRYTRESSIGRRGRPSRFSRPNIVRLSNTAAVVPAVRRIRSAMPDDGRLYGRRSARAGRSTPDPAMPQALCRKNPARSSSIAVAIRNGIPSTIITRSILPKSSELTCGSKLSRDRSRR